MSEVMVMGMLERTVAYYRSSSNKQVGSVVTQEMVTQKFAADHALYIDKTYIDDGVSAYRTSVDERPGMVELKNEILQGRVQNLLVNKRDRLARNAVEYLEFLRLCKTNNVNILLTAPQEVQISFQSVGEYIEVLMAGLIQQESETMSSRFGQDRFTNFDNEEFVGRIPFGYVTIKDGKKRSIEVVDTERMVIELIFEKWLTGEYSDVLELARYLNAQGFRNRNQKWAKEPLTNILRHPMYLGKHTIRYNGKSTTKDLPELRMVSDENWQKSQLLLNELTVKNKPLSVVFPLEGLVFCKKCAKQLVSKQNPEPIYSCSKCKIKIPRNTIEPIILSRVRWVFEDIIRNHSETVLKKLANEELIRTKPLLQQQKQRIKTLKDALFLAVENHVRMSDKVTKERLKEEMVELQHRMESEEEKLELLQKTLEQSNARLLSLSGELRARLHDSDVWFTADTKQELGILLHDVLFKAEVDTTGIDVFVKHPYCHVKELMYLESD